MSLLFSVQGVGQVFCAHQKGSITFSNVGVLILCQNSTFLYLPTSSWIYYSVSSNSSLAHVIVVWDSCALMNN